MGKKPFHSDDYIPRYQATYADVERAEFPCHNPIQALYDLLDIKLKQERNRRRARKNKKKRLS